MRKKVLAALGCLGVIVATLIGKGIGQQAGGEAWRQLTKPDKAEWEQALIEGLTIAAERSNERGPVMVDEETRLDRTEVGPGAVATYHHSFTNYSSSQITAEIVEAKVEPTVRQNVCGNADMRPSLEFGVTYVYAYSGNDGVAIYEFSINATDCGIPTGSP